MPKPLHECDFRAERVYDDRTGEFRGFTGRCNEWPDLRTKVYRGALDALDDVMDQVREKLRHIHASQNAAKEASRGA